MSNICHCRHEMVPAIDSIKQLVCALLVFALLLTGGCTRRVYFLREEDVDRYEKTATGIAWADVHEPSSSAVTDTLPPRTLTEPRTPHGIRDMTLQECIRITLANSEVIQDLGGRVLQSPEGTPTVYDPALVSTDPRSSVEAALSAFDANLSSSMTWSRTDRPVNNAVTVGELVPTLDAFIFQEDSANFLAELRKTTATGGTAAIRGRVDYSLNNAGSNRFPSAYDTNLEFEVRQPLLQRAGVEFNRIFGPSTAPGFYSPNGVLIARINEDISIAQFEQSVRDLVSQVEDTYWNLYFAYRELGAQLKARDAALATWQAAYARYETQSERGGLAEYAQAQERYHALQETVDATIGGTLRFVTDTSARGGLYGIESDLRKLMGLPVNDGYLIRPADEPVTAPYKPEWSDAMADALTFRVELRQQKWRVKQSELTLIGTRNFLLPQLDVFARYRLNGFGDRLLAADSDNERFQNSLETLTGGNFTDWELGLQLSVPIGLRQAFLAQYYAENRLAQDRKVLQAQEEEIAHGVGVAFVSLDTAHRLIQYNFNRFQSAREFLRSTEVLYDLGIAPLDRLLDAQQILATAESAYWRSAVDYTLALKQLEFEKGTLLAYNNVRLTEGAWPARAYEDSFERARERYHARPVNIGKTEPLPFVDLRDADAVSTVGSAADKLFDEPNEPDDSEQPALFPAEPPSEVEDVPAFPEPVESDPPGFFEPPAVHKPIDVFEAPGSWRLTNDLAPPDFFERPHAPKPPDVFKPTDVHQPRDVFQPPIGRSTATRPMPTGVLFNDPAPSTMNAAAPETGWVARPK